MGDYYEDPQILAEYLLFHFGNDEEILKWDFGTRDSTQFPERIALRFKEHYPKKEQSQPLRALDIGCAVGRSSFELSRFADEVVGIDYSHAFVDAANRLLLNGELPYAYKVQGKRKKEAVAKIPSDLPSTKKISFQQGDATLLPCKDLGTFDIVLASNLICRLPEPKNFFDQLPLLVKANGVFVLSTPYSYLEEFTPVEHWMGGTDEDHLPFDAIQKQMEAHFELPADYAGNPLADL